MVIGSEMSGDVQNVVISNCVFIGTDRGIRFKSRRGRGGIVEDVRISNLIMDGVLCPFTMNLYYGCGAWGDPVVSDKNHRQVDEGTPRFRRIHLSGITARNVKLAAGFIYGLAEMPVEDIFLDDVTISLASNGNAGYPEMADDIPQMQQAGFFVRNAHNLHLKGIEIINQRGPAFDIADSADVNLCACGSSATDEDQPVIRLNNVNGAFIHACQFTRTKCFLKLEGEQTRGIILTGNALAIDAVYSDASVPRDAIKLIH